MDRRDFLRLSGAGLAGAALLATVGSGGALAQGRGSSSLQKEFEKAAREYRVPVELLLAMAYVNTRFDMPPPEANEYEKGSLHGQGTYGIMQLVQNPFQDTLGEAARLTGISEEDLKTDRASNIAGGAALLASSQGAKPRKLKDWFGAVSGKGGNGKDYKAVSGVGAGEPFAEDVFKVLKKGVSMRTRRGEQVSLPAQSPEAETTAEGEVR